MLFYSFFSFKESPNLIIGSRYFRVYFPQWGRATTSGNKILPIAFAKFLLPLAASTQGSGSWLPVNAQIIDNQTIYVGSNSSRILFWFAIGY
jgi:hypothetical protein